MSTDVIKIRHVHDASKSVITYKNFLLKLFQYQFEPFQKKALATHPQRYHHIVTTAQPSVIRLTEYL